MATSIGELALKIGVNDKEISKLRNVFKKIVVDVKDLEKETKRATKQLQRMGRVLGNQVAQGFSTASRAAAALTKETFMVGTSFEQAIKTVQAISGLTADQMGQLEFETRRLGATTSFTAIEAANAMTTLARSGMDATDLLNVTSSALYFAGAAVTSLDNSATLLAATMKQFSMDSSQAATVTDTFTHAIKGSLFDMQSLTAAMRYGGSIGSSFNMTLEETVASLAMFRNLGLEGSMAGTQFRMAMSKATKETNRGKVALDKYNLTYNDINPQLNTFMEIMEKVGKVSMSMQDIITVFGVRSAGSISKISKQAVQTENEFTKLMLSMRTGGDITKQLYEEIQDTVQQQLKIVKSAQEDVAIQMFEPFKRPMKQFLKETSATFAQISNDLQRTTDVTVAVQAFEELGNTVRQQRPEVLKLLLMYEDLQVSTLQALDTLIPLTVKFGQSMVASGQAIVSTFNTVSSTLNKVGQGISDTINLLLAGFPKANEESNSLAMQIVRIVNASNILFAIFSAAMAGGAVALLIAGFVRLIAIIAKTRLVMTLLGKTAEATAVKMTILQRVMSLGFGGIVSVVVIATTAVQAFGTALFSNNDKVRRAIELQSELEKSLKRTTEAFNADIQTNQLQSSMAVIDKMIAKVKEQGDATDSQTKLLIKSLEKTKTLTEEQVRQGKESGQLIKITTQLAGEGNKTASAFISVRDAFEASGNKVKDFGTQTSAALENIHSLRISGAKLSSSFSETTSQFVDQTAELRSLKDQLEKYEGQLGSSNHRQSIVKKNIQETKEEISALEGELVKTEESFNKQLIAIKENEKAFIDNLGALEKLGQGDKNLEAIIETLRSQGSEMVDTKENVDIVTEAIARYEQKLREGATAQEAFQGVVNEGFAIQGETIEEVKTKLSGFQTLLSGITKRFQTMIGTLLKLEVETPTPDPDDDDKVDPNASKRKSLAEARIKLIEELNKRERDIYARTTEIEKNRLADRLQKIKEHFDKEMKLYKGNRRKREQLEKQMNDLLRQEARISVEENVQNTIKSLKEIGKARDEESNTQIQNINKVRDEQLRSVEELRNSNAELLGLANSTNSSLEERNKIEKEFVDSSKVVLNVFEGTDAIRARALQYAREQLLITDNESEAVRQARITLEEALNSEKSLQEDLQKIKDDNHFETLKNTFDQKAANAEQSMEYLDLLKRVTDAESTLNDVRDSIPNFSDKLRLAREKESRDLDALADQYRDTYVTDLGKAIDEAFKRRVDAETFAIDKGLEYQINRAELTQEEINKLNLSAEELRLLHRMMNIEKGTALEEAAADARARINADANEQILKLYQAELAATKENILSRLGQEKSLLSELLKERKAATEQAATISKGVAKEVDQVYKTMIPKILAESLKQQVNIYGSGTAAIVQKEKELFDARQAGLNALVDKLLSKSITMEDAFRLMTDRVRNSFNEMGTSFEKAENKFIGFLDILSGGARSVLGFLNPFKGLQDEFDRIDLDLKIDLSSVEGQIAVAKTQLQELRDSEKKLGPSSDLDESIKLQETKLLKLTNEQERITEESEKRKSDIVKQELAKTVGLITGYVGVISNFYKSAISGLQSLARIGVEAFTSLTGFSFDFGSGLSSVISGMDEVKKKQEEINKAQREGKLTPEQAQEAMAAASKSPADLAAEYIDNLIDKSMTFMDTFAETGPELVRRLVEKLPKITEKLSEILPIALQGFAAVLPSLLETLTKVASDFLTIIIDNLPSLIESLITAITEALPNLINVLVEKLPEIAEILVNGIVKVLPVLLTGLIELLPKFLETFVMGIVKLIPIIIDAFVSVLIPRLPEIAYILVIGIIKGIGILILTLIKGLGDALGFDTTGLQRSIENIGGGANTSFHSGIQYVPQKMMATLHQGEAVVPADVNARMQGGQNPAYAGSGAIGSRAMHSNAQPIDIAVMAEGRLLDAVQVLAMERGHAPKMNKRFQRASGVKVGFSRGKFSKYN